MHLPIYASCYLCGEYRKSALRLNGEKVVCYNCSSYAENRQQEYCLSCNTLLPCEKHHVYGRKVNPLFCVWLCVNCHRYIESIHGHEARINLEKLMNSIYRQDELEDILESENVSV